MKTHKLKLNGKVVTPAEFHRKGPVGGEGIAGVSKAYSDAKPLVSDGLGCMKDQVPEMREAIQERGIRGVRVLENGQLTFTSRRGRREVMAMRGLHDADGGYGDG